MVLSLLSLSISMLYSVHTSLENMHVFTKSCFTVGNWRSFVQVPTKCAFRFYMKRPGPEAPASSRTFIMLRHAQPMTSTLVCISRHKTLSTTYRALPPLLHRNMSTNQYAVATLERLYPNASLTSRDIDAAAPIVTPQGVAQPTGPTKHFLDKLRDSAQVAAAAAACGSVLAGQSSESDEFGDVAVWIPEDYANMKGEDVKQSLLTALGLDSWTEGKVSPLTLDEASSLPTTFPDTKTQETTMLENLLKTVDDKHAFSISRPPYVAYFLIGRVTGGWVGLAGIGVSSDE